MKTVEQGRGFRSRRARAAPAVAGVAALAILVPCAALGAQTRERPPGEALSEVAPVPPGEASHRCLELSRSEEPFALEGARLVSEACRVTEAGSLIRADDVDWHWVLYRREFVYEAGAGARPEDLRFFPDTVREDELVLFVEAVDEGMQAAGAAAEATLLRPVWHDRSDARFAFIRPPRAAMRPADPAPSALLVHRRCLNGTGGCMDHPYALLPDATVDDLRPVYLAELDERLPEGWGTWKGVWIDPEGPRLDTGVYLPADANCCPSFRASAGLSIAADGLSLDSLALVPEAAGFAWEILPGRSFGHVSAGTSEEDLVRAYGRDAVEPAEVHLAEGVCTPGARVFPGAPWEMEVTWADSARSLTAFARVSGTEGPWHTPRGVRLGTTLTELEALRGEPVRFSGFGWDHGGRLWWEEGEGGLRLLLGPDSASNRRLHGDLRDDARSEELFGDRLVRSDHPLVRALVIRVERMTLAWENPAMDTDCERGRSRGVGSP